MSTNTWVDAVTRLRAQRKPAVLVTLISVRGHAPRKAGAKMVVASDELWGTIGGGNLEAVAIEQAKAMIASGTRELQTVTSALSDKAPYQHGVQCCGGEVTMLLEPLPVVPVVAIFGLGHVGMELARILARHEIDLHLVDSRADQLVPERLSALDDAIARVSVHHDPLLPESVLDGLPPTAYVLIMTHDHAEDSALCDAALRHEELPYIGLIGSSAKWARFRKQLAEAGHTPQEIERITTPVGLTDIAGKEPAVIAVSIAADLLRRFQRLDESDES